MYIFYRNHGESNEKNKWKLLYIRLYEDDIRKYRNNGELHGQEHAK